MGLFTDSQTAVAETVYEKTKLYLKPKDGKKHIILIHTLVPNGNMPERIYTIRINEIIEYMQNEGYEITDIKLEIGGTQGLSYETLITYK